ncbi:MerR family transcriptional regulator [Clostridium botulinum]|uniref:MerR family transcriptional regulator n=1 Tax=Clostridium botulinum TaxID=1491 RepID=UPI001C9B6825|nr:MerR family transcriptional regulator [Clostridium botulinum]MBY6796853.1 MerR family transcriptional regulator [Clostridium botulinum]MBY6866723.1 MerR family transcriptional regulator [Clostridium botulinum]
MFKIGEFSVLTSISIHMLRNYDKIGLLTPKYIDESTGYRYYESDQLPIANQIMSLKMMGFGLKEIAALQLEEMQIDNLKDILKNKIEDKEQEVKVIRKQLAQIESALKNLTSKNEQVLSIITKCIPYRKVASFRTKIEQFPDEGVLWKTLGDECEKLNVQFLDSNYSIAIQHEINFDENYIDVEVQRLVENVYESTDKVKFYSIPSCEVASLVYQGGYSRLKDINIYLAKWIKQNGLEICGPVFNIYYVSPEHKVNEEKFITEVCFPIKKDRVLTLA